MIKLKENFVVYIHILLKRNRMTMYSKYVLKMNFINIDTCTIKTKPATIILQSVMCIFCAIVVFFISDEKNIAFTYISK